MKGLRFSQFIPEEMGKVGFDELLKIFMQLLNVSTGDVSEALSYLNEIDKEYNLTSENDLEVEENEYKTSACTVLMIDISHSMILYGEDRITPAKKVAMALAELITTKFKKDTLDIIVFGNDAWPIEIKIKISKRCNYLVVEFLQSSNYFM